MPCFVIIKKVYSDLLVLSKVQGLYYNRKCCVCSRRSYPRNRVVGEIRAAPRPLSLHEQQVRLTRQYVDAS